ncbi:MAG TPA: S46 family peptidase, partial [Saprospiraceae bacterium]|nr:S46 family peptidase [Saprospiraceae bacterium]
MYKFLQNRNNFMMGKYNLMKNDPEKEYESQELLNRIANIANSMKVYGGITKGLNDPALFNRKVEMENYIRSKSSKLNYWDELAAMYKQMRPLGWASIHLSPSPFRGNIFSVMHDLEAYKELVVNKESDAKKDRLKSIITGKLESFKEADQK